MKKIGLIGLAVVLIGAAGWSALWFTGRSGIESRIESEIERFTAQGYEISHGEHQVSGFPVGYEVVYEDVVITDPTGMVRYELPRITGAGDVSDPDRVVFTFPPEFQAVVTLSEDPAGGDAAGEDPASEEAAGEDGSGGDAADGDAAGEEPAGEKFVLPETVTVEIKSENLIVETTAPDNLVLEFATSADSVLVVVADEGSPIAAAVELIDLEGETTYPTTPEVGAITGRSTIGRLEYVASFVDPEGVRTTVEGNNDAIAVAGSSTMRTQEDWQALFLSGGNEGEAEFSYQSGEAEYLIRVEGGDDGMDGVMTQSAGTGGGVMRVANGRVEMRASSENNRYSIAPDEADAPIRGEVKLGSLDVVYDAPIAPLEEMQPFAMRLALSGFEVADSLWDLIDPNGTLDREVAHLVFEIEGTGRMVGPTGEGAEPDRPLELGNVEIVAANVDALGADIVAEGALEFIQPINIPEGKITLRTRNLLDLIGKLAALGVIDEGSYQMATMMSAIYTRPGASEGELVSEIEFSLDGILINGLPVQ